MIKLSFSDYSASDRNVGYYHLENPTPTPWTTIANSISKFREADLPQIPLTQWLEKVKQHGLEDANTLPILRLPEFFERVETSLGLDIRNTLAVAPEVDYGKVKMDLVERYLAYQAR